MKLHHHYHHRKTMFLENEDAKERERKIRHHIMDKLFWANLKLVRHNPFGTRGEGHMLADRRRINDVSDPLAVLRRNVHKAFTTSGGGEVDFFDDYIRGGRATEPSSHMPVGRQLQLMGVSHYANNREVDKHDEEDHLKND